MNHALIKRLSAVAAALVIANVSFVMFTDPVSSQTAESFRDDFTSISYAGNNGTINWSGSWQESGENDGPASGSVQVTASDRCFGGSGNCLRIGSDGGSLNNHGASRTANLDSAASATLSFSYRRQTQGQVQGNVTAQVSGNGGSSWSTLITINMAGPQKQSSATFDISGHTGPSTVVRFRGLGPAINGYLHIDSIAITADMASPTTTSTIVTTTIPGTQTTTTPTVPGTPTTTTTPGAPTTTTSTVPGTPTTTTTPGAPTTTVAGSPTTTAISETSTSAVEGLPSTTNPGSTSSETTPTTTPTGGTETTMSDAPDDATPNGVQAVAQQEVGSPSGEPTRVAIAVETVTANAMTLAILALLASGLMIAGVDRAKHQSTPSADADVEPEPPAEN